MTQSKWNRSMSMSQTTRSR